MQFTRTANESLHYGIDTSELALSSIARRVWFDDENLWLLLSDGRQLAVPLSFYPRLLHATPEQRRKYTKIGGGIGLHWEELDEDILVAALLLGRRDQTRLGRGLMSIEEARKLSAGTKTHRIRPKQKKAPKPRLATRRHKA